MTDGGGGEGRAATGAHGSSSDVQVGPGSTVAGRYDVLEERGTGAMGTVFLAVDREDGAEVALKVLRRDKARKKEVLLRFRREGEILRSLGHPGIVELRDAGRAPEGIDYLAMERLTGPTLTARLQDGEPFSARGWLPILVALADALGAAHDAGVVHRDLKPDNIFLVEADDSEDGEPGPPARLVDFGLSLWAEAARVTKTGTMIGTPRYMSPEQIRSAKGVDARTDIYALGVVTHEALTGASPFPAEDAGQLLGCVMAGRVLPLEELRPGIPAALGDVVRRAMARDHGDRFETVGAFAEAYAAALGLTTGRSGLLEQGTFRRLLRAPEARGTEEALDPDHFAGEAPAPRPSPTPRFTSPSPYPARHAAGSSTPPPPPAPRWGPWSVFVLVALIVVLGSAGMALGLRAYLGRSSRAPAATPAPAQ
ncbi:MAG: serine/threonine-protein kinase [Sandaracinaceae bacterium]